MGAAPPALSSGLFAVWLGEVPSLDSADGVAPLPAAMLPLPESGFEPFGIASALEGELGVVTVPPSPIPLCDRPLCTPLLFEGLGVLLIAGLPAAGSGVCADATE